MHSATRNVVGVVLAAGDSSRMGRPKALLPIGCGNFLGAILARMIACGCATRIVVAGRDATLLRETAASTDSLLVVNPTPEDGQFSSLVIALRALPENADAALVTLVDHPLVSAATYRRLVTASSENPDRIIVPVHDGRRGHPYVIPNNFVSVFLKSDGSDGARSVIRKNSECVVGVDVDDPGVRADIDDTASYERHIGPLPGAG
jgi:molybdenum cofactor cytidylyltransferase